MFVCAFRDSPDLVRQFLADSAAGFEYAVARPEEAASLLIVRSERGSASLLSAMFPFPLLFFAFGQIQDKNRNICLA